MHLGLTIAVLLAAGPKSTGTYFPAVAAAHIEQGDFEPIDLATYVTFKGDTLKITWPAEAKALKFKTAKDGLEVKVEKAFVPVRWANESDGSVTTTLLYFDEPKPDETALRWVPQTLEQLWASWQKRNNERAYKRLAGTWTNGEHTLEIVLGDELAKIPMKVTWDGKPMAFNADECREGCGKFGTVCLTPPASKADTVPRLAYLNATLVDVLPAAQCTSVPREAWGFSLVGGAPLKRQ
jgi:hypothetical protein